MCLSALAWGGRTLVFTFRRSWVAAEGGEKPGFSPPGDRTLQNAFRKADGRFARLRGHGAII